MGEQRQRLRIGVPLPDRVETPGSQVDRLFPKDLLGNVHQHPVAQLDCVVEPHNGTTHPPLS